MQEGRRVFDRAAEWERPGESAGGESREKLGNVPFSPPLLEMGVKGNIRSGDVLGSDPVIR